MTSQLELLKAEMATLKRQVLGPKSEKMPPMDREVAKVRPRDPASVQAKRRANAQLRATRVKTEDVLHKVPPDQRRCPKCGREDARPVGLGKVSCEWDWVPGYFRRRRHIRETLACSCGQHIVTAPGPEHAVEGTRYSDGFRAAIVTAKCGDSIPLYRQAKQLARLGIPISRSTLGDLFHQAARELAPLAARVLALVAQSEVVLADETSLKMLQPNKRGFVWTFNADNFIAYRFSADRSGETPVEVLGGTNGTLVVDMYTGYNEVTSTGGRQRAACLAHARRRFFEAMSYAPEARQVLEMIRDVYIVEHDAKAAGVVRTAEHRQMRHARSRPIMDRLKALLVEWQPHHAPKSPMGSAISYTLRNWTELTRFLDDERIPPDNNRSEAALRVVALGRKNFLFVGNEDAGDNIAGLYSLVATCEANGVNPTVYLADVLGRVRSQPASALDDILPHRWKPPPPLA